MRLTLTLKKLTIWSERQKHKLVGDNTVWQVPEERSETRVEEPREGAQAGRWHGSGSGRMRITSHSGSATELVAAPHHPTVHGLGGYKSPTGWSYEQLSERKREEDSSWTVAFCSMPTTLCQKDEPKGFSRGCNGRVGEQYQNLHGIWLMFQKTIVNIRIIAGGKEYPCYQNT